MGTLSPSRRRSRGVSIARLPAIMTCWVGEENVEAEAMPCRRRRAGVKLLMTLEGERRGELRRDQHNDSGGRSEKESSTTYCSRHMSRYAKDGAEPRAAAAAAAFCSSL